MDIRTILSVLSLIYFLVLFRSRVSSLPVTQQKTGSQELKPEENEKRIESEIDDLGLEYGRYLQQVVEALEEDKEFAKKLENVSQEEIKNGAIARELNLVDHRVRNKLDELKRIEMERLRALARKEQKLEAQEEDKDGERRRWRTLEGKTVSLDAEHVDHGNPHSFEAEDLQKLILQATKDLEALDQKRKEDFKRYEMEKEIQFRESVLNMTDSEREKEVKEHVEHKTGEHPKVHHPGSKKQLEQVWEEKDGMPAQEFDPKIFFQMHDINSDGFLDPEEVEAILSVEVKKLYSDPRSDQNEMQEEYHRMREHIYKEADHNRDGLISKKEFLEFTRRMEFERDEGWKGLDEQQVYSEEELKRYQQQRAHPNQQQQHEQQEQYQYYQQYQGQGQGHHPYPQHPPVEQYIPNPQQMSAQEWHNLQQQYYQQQLHAQNQIPNQQLHAQQQQQQQYHVPQPMVGQHVPQNQPMGVQHVQQNQPMVGQHVPQNQHVPQQPMGVQHVSQQGPQQPMSGQNVQNQQNLNQHH